MKEEIIDLGEVASMLSEEGLRAGFGLYKPTYGNRKKTKMPRPVIPGHF
ncbi:hypothetical protein [Rufibacter tibetensis]|nr:hypothetical protein [Rufibacter tibetensis]